MVNAEALPPSLIKPLIVKLATAFETSIVLTLFNNVIDLPHVAVGPSYSKVPPVSVNWPEPSDPPLGDRLFVRTVPADTMMGAVFPVLVSRIFPGPALMKLLPFNDDKTRSLFNRPPLMTVIVSGLPTGISFLISEVR